MTAIEGRCGHSIFQCVRRHVGPCGHRALALQRTIKWL